jgi:hypothetical protein
VYQPGLDSTNTVAWDETCPFDRGYFAGNSMDGEVPADPWSLIHFSSSLTAEMIAAYELSSPVEVVDMPTDTAEVAYERVLEGAGATVPERDPIDLRIVDDVRNGTGHNIANESEVGGWPEIASGTPPPDADHDGMPDDWETARGLDPNDASDRNGDRDGDGYTNLEEYLNGIPWTTPEPPDAGDDAADAAPVADAAPPPDASQSNGDDDVTGGCGCRTAPPPGRIGGAGLLWPLGVLVLAGGRAQPRQRRGEPRGAAGTVLPSPHDKESRTQVTRAHDHAGPCEVLTRFGAWRRPLRPGFRRRARSRSRTDRRQRYAV